MKNGGEGLSMGVGNGQNIIFSYYKLYGQKKIKTNSVGDVIFIESNVGRTTTVIHDQKK